MGGFVWPDRPRNIGFKARAAVGVPRGYTLWQLLQSRVSFLAKRVPVSVARPTSWSMVQTRTGHPASSTRRTIFSVSLHDTGMYNWYQGAAPSARATSSTGVEVTVESIITARWARA